MHADRQACLDAGMNDHVGKPFDLTQLVKVLRQHTHWATRSPAVAPSSLRSAKVEARVWERDIQWPVGMEGAAALARMGGNVTLLIKVVRAFALDAQGLPDRVDMLMRAKDSASLQRELHSFKGLTATLGLHAVAGLVVQAESLAKQGDFLQLRSQPMVEMMAAVRSGLVQMVPVLLKLADRLEDAACSQVSNNPGTPSLNASAELVGLRQLNALLSNSDMAAMELYASLRQNANAALGDHLERLDTSMAELDFELAAQQCAALIDQLTLTP
jgi:HPt (histidine-containing phosphotransfer) domain-containing protein